MILLIDNYDSFSYNLVQLLGGNEEIKVIRNDEMTIEEIRNLSPSHIVVSPGPGRPSDAGISEEVIKTLGKEIPTLGVCLGHQAICEVFGATITYAKTLMHGKQSTVSLDNASKLFKDMTSHTKVARYHSLAADAATMPECLKITSIADDNEIMAVEHTTYPIYGLQFHPESVLTPEGQTILDNFLKI